MNKTGIEYLDYTWSPIAMRCTKVSPACDNCWHLRAADRLMNNPKISKAKRRAYAGEDDFVLDDNELAAPLKIKKHSIIGVQFMGDLFHESIKDNWIGRIYGHIAAAHWHKFVVLTKRPKRMKEFHHMLAHYPKGDETKLPVSGPPSNLWIGVTAEDQQRADERIPILLSIPAAVHFVSFEPLLGPINIKPYLGKISGCRKHCPTDYNSCRCLPGDCRDAYDSQKGLDIVIIGGETGKDARPMYPAWPRHMRDDCQASSTCFYFKGWGVWVPYNDQPGSQGPRWTPEAKKLDRRQKIYVAPNGSFSGVSRYGSEKMVRMHKNFVGNHFDGRTWEEWPNGI